MTGGWSGKKISQGKLQEFQVKDYNRLNKFLPPCVCNHTTKNKNLLNSKGIRSFDFLAPSSEPPLGTPTALEKSFQWKINSFSIMHSVQIESKKSYYCSCEIKHSYQLKFPWHLPNFKQLCSKIQGWPKSICRVTNKQTSFIFLKMYVMCGFSLVTYIQRHQMLPALTHCYSATSL